MKPRCDATGKAIYLTEGDAKQAMSEMKRSFHWWLGKTRNKRRHKKPKQKRVYFCVYCEGFHLTSQKIRSDKIRIEKRDGRKYETEVLNRLIRPKDYRASLQPA